MCSIPVKIFGRSLAARSFTGRVPCRRWPTAIDLRKKARIEVLPKPVEGKDYLPGTYVERWYA